MRIQYLSDLHLESHAFTLKHNVDADVIVLAGDITTMNSLHRFDNLLKTACQKPVVYVCGNHEFYNSSIEGAKKEIRKFCDKYKNFHFLDDGWVEIDYVRFVGGTLFTDFNLYEDQASAKRNAQFGISDFHCIVHNTMGGDMRLVTPDDYVDWHRKAKDLIRLAKQDYYGDIVVVTHFVPSRKAIAERWLGSPLNPFFTSDCEDLMGDNVKAWIFGHTHDSSEFEVRGTKCVCNPRGYTSYENNSFKSTRLVEV